MKKILAIVVVMMGFVLSANAHDPSCDAYSASGDIVTSCEVYGEPGAIATLNSKGGQVDNSGRVQPYVSVSGCKRKSESRTISVWVNIIDMNNPLSVLDRVRVDVYIGENKTSGSFSATATGLPKGAYVVFSISQALTCK